MAGDATDSLMGRKTRNPWPAASKRRRYKPGKVPRPIRFHTRGPVRQEKSWAQAFSETRPWLLVIALVTLVAIWQTPGFYNAPSFLESDPETVAESFTRCGPGRGHACVTDGDTIKLGDRKIRVVGIDTPEVAAQCTGERVLAEAATARMQAWLNEGPFVMVGRIDEPTDRYGRDLRSLRRKRPDGRYEDVADIMRAEGLARRYAGGFRRSWCDMDEG